MKDYFFNHTHKFRYEYKFFIQNESYDSVERHIKIHPAIFKDIFHLRRVSNIYLDSFDLGNYMDNVNGGGKRLKIRIRWYGRLFGLIEKPVLELKLKEGTHVSKLSYPLIPFQLDSEFSIQLMRSVFEESAVPQMLKQYLKGMNFTLLNSYQRKYYLSSDHIFRCTLDNQIEVYRLNPFQNMFLDKYIDCDSLILELKWSTSSKKSGDLITRHLPYRITRSSKYVTGIDMLEYL